MLSIVLLCHQDGRRVCSISQHLVGEVDLTSGGCNKVTKLTRLTRTAAAITVAKEGQRDFLLFFLMMDIVNYLYMSLLYCLYF